MLKTNPNEIQSGTDLELRVFDKSEPKANKSLFHIEKDYLELMSEVESLEGELTDELNNKLAIVEKDLNQKSIAYLSVIKTKESYVKLIDAEIKRLQALKKSNEKVIERLENSILNAVKIFGKFTVGFTTFGTRKSKSVDVTCNVNDLPKEYKVIKVTEQPDKDAIKQALESGKKIEGCAIVEKENLKIN